MVRLTVRGALNLPLAQLSAEVARAHDARWQVAGGADLAQALAAVGRLWQVGVSPGQLLLHGPYVSGDDLRELWQAGVRSLAWSVQSLSPAHAGYAALTQAVQIAKKIGFSVQLRWTVAAETAPQLGDLAGTGWADLGCAELVVQPDLTAGRTPSALLLRQFWPKGRERMPRLVASQLWPLCLDLPCDALEPVPDAAAAQVGQRPLCRDCPAAHQCPGIAAAVRAACDSSPQPWRGMALDAGVAAADPAQEPPGASDPTALRFAGESIEMRGLRMGLRDAWRLRLSSADLPAFAAAARRDGWQVAWTEHSFAGHAGGRLTQVAPLGAESAHLVVVARSEALAERCVADELALLRPGDQRSPPAVSAMIAAHERLGAAYGFPSCCVQAFCDAFGEVVYTDRIGDNAVAVLRAALRSKRFDPRCFTLVAGLGQPSASPLRHLPCRFDCPASLALASQLQPERPPAWPVVVWADGSFAIVQGRLGESGEVVDVVAADAFGFDPAYPQNSADRLAFANPLAWSTLMVRPGHLQFEPLPGAIAVPASHLPWSQRFPILLPFANDAPG